MGGGAFLRPFSFRKGEKRLADGWASELSGWDRSISVRKGEGEKRREKNQDVDFFARLE